MFKPRLMFLLSMYVSLLLAEPGDMLQFQADVQYIIKLKLPAKYSENPEISATVYQGSIPISSFNSCDSVIRADLSRAISCMKDDEVLSALIHDPDGHHFSRSHAQWTKGEEKILMTLSSKASRLPMFLSDKEGYLFESSQCKQGIYRSNPYVWGGRVTWSCLGDWGKADFIAEDCKELSKGTEKFIYCPSGAIAPQS